MHRVVLFSIFKHNITKQTISFPFSDRAVEMNLQMDSFIAKKKYLIVAADVAIFMPLAPRRTN